MENKKTTKKINLTFEYEILTPVKTTGVFDENSNGWEYASGLLKQNREHLEMNGSVGGGYLNYHLFENDVPHLVKQPPHTGTVQITGIEVYEEDEGGNQTQKRNLQYEDFPFEG